MKHMHGMIYDDKNACYIARKTGEVVLVERIDEYAWRQLGEAVSQLAEAFVAAAIRAETVPHGIHKQE